MYNLCIAKAENMCYNIDTGKEGTVQCTTKPHGISAGSEGTKTERKFLKFSSAAEEDKTESQEKTFRPCKKAIKKQRVFSLEKWDLSFKIVEKSKGQTVEREV